MSNHEHKRTIYHFVQWEELFDGFMVESKWLAACLVPAAEDYLRNGVVTSGMPLALAHVLFLLGHDHAAFGDAARFTDHIPPAISCPGKILRLWDDRGSAEVRAEHSIVKKISNPNKLPANLAARPQQLNFLCRMKHRKDWMDPTGTRT